MKTNYTVKLEKEVEGEAIAYRFNLLDKSGSSVLSSRFIAYPTSTNVVRFVEESNGEMFLHGIIPATESSKLANELANEHSATYFCQMIERGK